MAAAPSSIIASSCSVRRTAGGLQQVYFSLQLLGLVAFSVQQLLVLHLCPVRCSLFCCSAGYLQGLLAYPGSISLGAAGGRTTLQRQKHHKCCSCNGSTCMSGSSCLRMCSQDAVSKGARGACCRYRQHCMQGATKPTTNNHAMYTATQQVSCGFYTVIKSSDHATVCTELLQPFCGLTKLLSVCTLLLTVLWGVLQPLLAEEPWWDSNDNIRCLHNSEC